MKQNRKINEKKEKEKSLYLKAAFVSTCIWMFLMVLLSYANPFRTEIRIQNLGETSSYSSGDQVLVKYIAINGVEEKLDHVSGEYLPDENDSYAFSLESGKKVTFRVPVFSRVTVAFKRTEDSGYVCLQSRGVSRKINLVGAEEDLVRCHPVVTPAYMWGLLLAGVLLVWGVLFQAVMNGMKSSCAGLRKLLNKNIVWILLSGLAQRIYFFRFFPTGYVVGKDSYTYELFFKRKYLMDIRTPVYPVFYRIADIFFDGEGVYRAVVFMQIVLGFLSIVLLWKILKDIVSEKWAILFTVLFANLPINIYYEHFLMSDSVSIFLMLWCIRLVQKYLQCSGGKLAFLLAVAVSVNVMERPGSIFLIPLLGVFFVLYALWEKRNYFHVAYVGIPVAVVLLYCMINYRNVGKFELSCVPVLYNGGYQVTYDNFYDGTDYPDVEDSVTRYKMLYGNNQWNYMDKLVKQYGADYTKFIKNAMSIHRREQIYGGIEKIIDNLATPVVHNNLSENREAKLNERNITVAEEKLWEEKILNNFLCPFSYGMVFLMVGITLLFCLWKWVINKRVLWMQVGVSGIIFCTTFIALWNSYNDYQRLTITIIPSLYILVS